MSLFSYLLLIYLSIWSLFVIYISLECLQVHLLVASARTHTHTHTQLQWEPPAPLTHTVQSQCGRSIVLSISCLTVWTTCVNSCITSAPQCPWASPTLCTFCSVYPHVNICWIVLRWSLLYLEYFVVFILVYILIVLAVLFPLVCSCRTPGCVSFKNTLSFKGKLRRLKGRLPQIPNSVLLYDPDLQ